MTPYMTPQKPHIIASLPQQVNSPSRNYVVGEVYGDVSGSRKRKRSELTVGIHGEGVNLYDISASRLITSYALPPQSYFTCPPCSLRTRVSKSKVERRTYVTTVNSKPQITLFYDSKEVPGETKSREISQDIGGSSDRVIFTGTILATRNFERALAKHDVILVKQDCEIQCYDGENLLEKWTSPASAIFQESHTRPDDVIVECAQLINAHSARQGLLKSRQDIFAVFSEEITKDGFNPELLVIITKSEKNACRTLHVVSLPRRLTQTTGRKNQRWVETLLVSQLPYTVRPNSSRDDVNISLQASGQTLQYLEDGVLTILDLTPTIPKVQYQLKCQGAQSFIRLSNTLSMISFRETISVYNPKYHSRLATIGLDPSFHESLKRKRGFGAKLSHTCRLVSYLPKLAVVLAIVGSNLIGIQVDYQQDGYGKRRAAGLLIDSLGCAISEEARPILDRNQEKKKSKNEFQTLKPVKQAETATKTWSKFLETNEALFAKGGHTVESFDRLMAPYLTSDRSNRVSEISNQISLPSITDETPVSSARPLQVDKRWVFYALSKIFSLSNAENGETRLSIPLYARNTLMWLIQHGYVTTDNIEFSLTNENSTAAKIAAGDLTCIIMKLDPDLNLLFALITYCHLSADELLHTIRRLMESVGLWDNNLSAQKDCFNDEQDYIDSEISGDSLKKKSPSVDTETDRDISFVERKLGRSSGIRGQALNQALFKLYTYPDETIVHSLRKNYSPQATACLIYLLRFKLALGGWTTRYLDTDAMNIVGEKPNASENLIMLISNLLSCCIDAIGAGGWLSGESQLFEGDPFEAEELISSLKIEVSAALEGIEEMVYLQRIFGEMVRYGDLIQKETAGSKTKDSSKPTTLASDQPMTFLPLGLKVDKHISLLKMRTGGEITRRTMREVGDLKSRKVEKYSRERITV